MNLLEATPQESVLFEDSKLVVALAYEPLTKGHTVVVWKGGESDINKLDTEDYEYLMDAVDVARDTLKKFYGVEKVYLMYLDESNWVHWHLVPRYDEKGFNVLNHKPERIDDFKDVEGLSDIFKELYQKMVIEN